MRKARCVPAPGKASQPRSACQAKCQPSEPRQAGRQASQALPMAMLPRPACSAMIELMFSCVCGMPCGEGEVPVSFLPSKERSQETRARCGAAAAGSVFSF